LKSIIAIQTEITATENNFYLWATHAALREKIQLPLKIQSLLLKGHLLSFYSAHNAKNHAFSLGINKNE
jgi:hypothetical protein